MTVIEKGGGNWEVVALEQMPVAVAEIPPRCVQAGSRVELVAEMRFVPVGSVVEQAPVDVQ